MSLKRPSFMTTQPVTPNPCAGMVLSMNELTVIIES